MILNFVQVASAVRGAESVELDGKWIQFHRFTEAQRKIYEEIYPGRAIKTPATAGVRLAFVTDSNTLAFSFRFFKCQESPIPRIYPRIDVYQDGAMIKHVGLDDYIDREARAEVALGEGSHKVELYLPWVMATELSDVTLDDGASFEPFNRSRTMLQYGDSITQGYDCKYPSLTYASTLARLLDADAMNKGIGGEIFFPELLDEPVATAPDYITVAYGTNDWRHLPYETIAKNCRAFYKKLSELYPKSTIFAISPIWRGDAAEGDACKAPVSVICDLISQQTADLENVTVICGDNLAPHMKAFTSDSLHPIDAGAQIYAQNLYRIIETYM
ncbi:MAG: hypothetical protein E7637_02690 [Ruminococcaceae bacterium]|nr:hypothetical protein [Oscillospiraceae bacterium]